ncbi:MAG: hypothetical protein ACLTQI_03670 [Slackia sp.]
MPGSYVEGYYEDEALCANAHYREAPRVFSAMSKIDEQVAGDCLGEGRLVDEHGDIATVGVTADEKMCATPECLICRRYSGDPGLGWRGGREPSRFPSGHADDCSNCQACIRLRICGNTCHDYETPQGWTNPISTVARSRKTPRHYKRRVLRGRMEGKSGSSWNRCAHAGFDRMRRIVRRIGL